MQYPDIESLRCFDVAATHLNFRAAATLVALSPSAFTDRIQRLEELLGVKLFVRTTRRVSLTPAGRRLHPEVQKILGDLGACVRTARGEGPYPPFLLKIGTRYELGLSWIVPSLQDLENNRPERRVDLVFGDSQALLLEIESGTLDAMVSSVRLTQVGLNFASLHREEYVFVAATSLLNSWPICEPNDTSPHRLIDVRPELPLFRYFLDAWSPGEDWKFASREHLGTIGAVKLRILAGAGIGVLPRYFVKPEIEAGELTALFPETALLEDVFRLIWRENHPLDDELRGLAAELSSIPLR